MSKPCVPDEKQKSVIEFNSGYALVLAAPGCGKTEILSHRVSTAHKEYGIPYSDMLCVTFTNRASRAMRERIQANIGDDVNELFVGNIHRFCINFLFENEIIPIDTGIIDDTDQLDYIYEIKEANNDKTNLMSWDIKNILDYACYLREKELGLPVHLQLHSNVELRYEWGGNVNEARKRRDLKYAQDYLYLLRADNVIDFDDILYYAYKALSDEGNKHKYQKSAYRWIQVDEVQDLNPLQFAIIDLLLAKDFTSMMFLGDTRQAIYSFLGTSKESVSGVMTKCGNNIFHLSNNYRSPSYLLDMLNDYAREQLKIDADKLPSTTNREYIDDGLTCVKCYDADEQYNVVATLTREIYDRTIDESVGILVRANKEADEISNILKQHRIQHLKITNKDMFKGVDFKTIYAHFSVVAMETRYTEWARVLYATKVLKTLKLARRCVKKMCQLGVTPADLMRYENSSYFMEFCKAYTDKEIVIFDTETTGLDIFNDDIIQIAAMKVRNGIVVPGSEIDIVISTNKEIPATLKNGTINPMVEEHRRRSMGIRNNDYEYFMQPEEALTFFVEYLGDADVLCHNAEFDVNILKHNIIRRCPGLAYTQPTYWDTLKLARLLDPKLQHYNLESLLKVYELEGENSHNAIDDVRATRSLMSYCYERCFNKIEEQRTFIEHDELKRIRKAMLEKYYPFYKHTLDKLYADAIGGEYTFDFELNYIYTIFEKRGYIQKIERFDYMRELFKKVVIKESKDIYFYQQYIGHLYEYRTFNEADLYQNGIISERIHIMTIHKSKGLEFDNTLVYNVSKDVVPHYRATTDEEKDESARVLYVALSRAKKRVYLTYEVELTPFIKDHDRVFEHFYDMPEGQKTKLLKYEENFVKFC